MWNFTPERSILCFAALQVRPARLNSLAPLEQKALRSFAKCSTPACTRWFPYSA
ncbi:hypothetical protein D3875_17180 [Deinococcus cavernae]|uniref:Uncharacterized protein n=1 Tax=Deinococcus cavernae TaxID=2320857 RepID=A0A418VCG0_9DEIO|nr:hypothetical protein D3875_17180 [Deinococcus cavernae]